jgi:prolyl-tRNA editing enzyme YbaK/EbsC (Cys-tRNA(Pro) deacylase)
MSDPRVRGVDAVTTYLAERGINFDVVEHRLTNTAAAEARAAGVPADHAAKNVALVDADRFALAVLPASCRLDLDKARGPLLDALEILDGRLLEHDTILFSGGDHRHGVLIDPHDLIEIAQPKVADICEVGPGRRRR